MTKKTTKTKHAKPATRKRRAFEIHETAIGETVIVAADLLVGKVSAVHSDGSRDVTLTNGTVLTSVRHLSRVNDPIRDLNARGWYSAEFDYNTVLLP